MVACSNERVMVSSALTARDAATGAEEHDASTKEKRATDGCPEAYHLHWRGDHRAPKPLAESFSAKETSSQTISSRMLSSSGVGIVSETISVCAAVERSVTVVMSFCIPTQKSVRRPTVTTGEYVAPMPKTTEMGDSTYPSSFYTS